MGRKVIFFDIDGTILPDRDDIPASAVMAIHKARENGHLCIVNTGRPYSHIDPRVKAIGFDGYICSIGSYILLKDRVLFHDGFPHEESVSIDEAIQKYRLNAAYESEEGIRYRVEDPGDYHLVRSKEHFHKIGMDTELPIDDTFCFDKCTIWFREDSDREGFLAFASDKGTVVDRDFLWELTRPNVSKETGIRMVMKQLHLAESDSYAIGDSANDLPMLRCVAHSIAMGEAPEALKKEVEYVTSGIFRDGLALALQHYGLIDGFTEEKQNSNTGGKHVYS